MSETKLDEDKTAETISQMTEAQVRQVFEICRRRLSALQQMQVATFRPGQMVSFTGRGKTLIGTVVKLNQKTASIKVERPGGPAQTWRVSPGLLSPA